MVLLWAGSNNNEISLVYPGYSILLSPYLSLNSIKSVWLSGDVLKTAGQVANILDPDQMSHSVASDLYTLFAQAYLFQYPILTAMMIDLFSVLMMEAKGEV